jgi:hypothetical protein
MKFSLTLLSILTFLSEISFSNPIDRFILNHDIGHKAILLTSNFSSCHNCQIPINVVIDYLRKSNNQIPLFIITNDSMTSISKNIYIKQNSIDTSFTHIEFNRELYDFLGKIKGSYSTITLISRQKRIEKQIGFNHDPLLSFAREIEPHFQTFIHTTMPVPNKIIDAANNYTNVLLRKQGGGFLLFNRGINLISDYDANTKNTSNLFLDSLNLKYEELLKMIFPTHLHESSLKYVSSKKLSKQQMITPISIFSADSNKIGVNFHIMAYKDTLYKKDSATYEFTSTFMILLDLLTKNYQIIKFPPSFSNNIIFQSQCAFLNGFYYYLAYDKNNTYWIIKFRENKNTMEFIQKYAEPIPARANDPLQTISNYQGLANDFFYTYESSRKGRCFIYKFNTATEKFEPVMVLRRVHFSGHFIYETPKKNYIFLGHKNNQLSVYGFDAKTGKITKPQTTKQSSDKFNYQTVPFVFDGYEKNINFME